MLLNPLQIQPEDFVGTWRRFGLAKPVYEIIGVGHETETGQMMRIRVVESGEETDYRLADLLDDPKER